MWNFLLQGCLCTAEGPESALEGGPRRLCIRRRYAEVCFLDLQLLLHEKRCIEKTLTGSPWRRDQVWRLHLPVRIVGAVEEWLTDVRGRIVVWTEKDGEDEGRGVRASWRFATVLFREPDYTVVLLGRAWLVASMRNDQFVLGFPVLSFQYLPLQRKRHVFLHVRRLVIIWIAIMQTCSPKLLKRIALMSTKRDVRKDSPAEGTCPIYGTCRCISWPRRDRVWPILNFVGHHPQTSLALYDCTDSAILVVVISKFNWTSTARRQLWPALRFPTRWGAPKNICLSDLACL